MDHQYLTELLYLVYYINYQVISKRLFILLLKLLIINIMIDIVVFKYIILL